MSTRDGGPAFPVHTGNVETRAGLFPVVGGGMSLRDWFAGQALAGILASAAKGDKEDKVLAAYQYADLMLAARSKQEGGSNE